MQDQKYLDPKSYPVDGFAILHEAYITQVLRQMHSSNAPADKIIQTDDFLLKRLQWQQKFFDGFSVLLSRRVAEFIWAHVDESAIGQALEPIENLLTAAPEQTKASFYRTAAGAEIDLVLELPANHGIWAIEIKRSLTARIEKGFHIACEDIKPSRRFVVYSGNDSYPVNPELDAISVKSLSMLLAAL